MVLEIRIRVDLYRRLQKEYLMLPCIALNIIRQGSRAKRSNPAYGAPFINLVSDLCEKKKA